MSRSPDTRLRVEVGVPPRRLLWKELVPVRVRVRVSTVEKVLRP